MGLEVRGMKRDKEWDKGRKQRGWWCVVRGLDPLVLGCRGWVRAWGCSPTPAAYNIYGEWMWTWRAKGVASRILLFGRGSHSLDLLRHICQGNFVIGNWCCNGEHGCHLIFSPQVPIHHASLFHSQPHPICLLLYPPIQILPLSVFTSIMSRWMISWL